MIMIREHYKEESYINWLKSIGCVMYLPLSVNDFQDKISGQSLQFTGNGSMVWDSSVQMYMITTPSSNGDLAYLDVWDASTFANNEFTTLATGMRKSTSSSKGSAINVVSINNVPCCIVTKNGTTNCARLGNAVINQAYYIGPSKRIVYEDGVKYSEAAAYTPFLPSNWGSYRFAIRAYDSYTKSSQMYYKELMAFNRELSLAEIRKLQGYD
jgi:hypothetical protein